MGPLLAVAFMVWFANDIRAVMWVAVVPAFIAVALLLVYVREPARTRGRAGALESPTRAAAASYWLVVLLGAVFTLRAVQRGVSGVARASVGSRSVTCPW